MYKNGMLRNSPSNELIKKESQFRAIMKRLSKNWFAAVGLVIIIIFIILAILGPTFAPYDYMEMDISNKFAPSSSSHLLGTDDLGRDIFSRLLYGARYSLGLGFAGQIFQLTIGTFLGCIAGYYGGKSEELIMRFCDIIQAIPNILLAVIVSAALGTGFMNTVIALGVGHIAGSCRIIRAQFLPLREQEFVEAEKSINCSNFRVIFRHILPNAISPLIVITTMGVGGCIMSAAGLSYLGLGVQPPTPEWGAMLTASREYMRHYPNLILYPGLCIAIVVLALNLLGDGLRDALDPKLKN